MGDHNAVVSDSRWHRIRRVVRVLLANNRLSNGNLCVRRLASCFRPLVKSTPGLHAEINLSPRRRQRPFAPLAVAIDFSLGPREADAGKRLFDFLTEK